MSLYKFGDHDLGPVARRTMAELKILERTDLQRLLRENIDVISPGTLVISEEYTGWVGSLRRIDLLGIDPDGTLVVFELKRTEDGGHMDLQGIRYAAMASLLSFKEVVEVYEAYLAKMKRSDDAETLLREHLETDSDAEVAGKVRIVLASADFGQEITTTVLWLNARSLDIRCVRMVPYQDGESIYLDVQQIIPVPEAADYLVKLREKEERREVASSRSDLFRRFWGQLISRSAPITPLLSGRTTSADAWISTGIGRGGFSLTLSLTQEMSQVECFIRIGSDAERSKAAFDALHANRATIDSAFGAELDWQELPGRNSCRICIKLSGGWRTPDAEWPALQDQMIDAMIRLEGALRKPIQEVEI